MLTVVLAVDPADLSPSGRGTLNLTVLISHRLATSHKVEWLVLAPADAPIIADVEALHLDPQIIVAAR